MNKRIRELMDQAGIDVEAVENLGEMPTAMKFAELIVRECILACGNHIDVERFGIYPIRVAMVTRACENNIKEHFGVEE